MFNHHKNTIYLIIFLFVISLTIENYAFAQNQSSGSFVAPSQSRNTNNDSVTDDSLAQRIINRFKTSRTCPNGMIYMRSGSRPTPDCYCPGGNKQVFDLKTGTTIFGGCVENSCPATPDIILSNKNILSVWLDASDPTPSIGIPSNNGKLRAWEDKSNIDGNAQAYNNDPVKQPEYTLNAINNRPAIKFYDGRFYFWGDQGGAVSGKKLTLDPLSESLSPYEIFIVFKSLNTNTTYMTLFSGLNKYKFSLNDGGASLSYMCKPSIKGSDTTTIEKLTDSTVHIANIRLSEQIFSNEMSINIDSTERTLLFNNNNICYQSKNNITPNDNSWVIGSSDINNGNGENFNGYIGEIIIVNNVLTLSQREAILKYLDSKWKQSNNDDCFKPELK